MPLWQEKHSGDFAFYTQPLQCAQTARLQLVNLCHLYSFSVFLVREISSLSMICNVTVSQCLTTIAWENVKSAVELVQIGFNKLKLNGSLFQNSSSIVMYVEGYMPCWRPSCIVRCLEWTKKCYIWQLPVWITCSCKKQRLTSLSN